MDYQFEQTVDYQFYVTSQPESAALRRPTLHVRRANHVYVRRRIVVASVFFSLLAALGVGAGNVLANRGGAPASATAVRQAITPGLMTTYQVQPGDTIWSIAENHHGVANLAHYVDDLIELNGGTVVQVGQLITLP